MVQVYNNVMTTCFVQVKVSLYSFGIQAISLCTIMAIIHGLCVCVTEYPIFYKDSTRMQALKLLCINEPHICCLNE